MKKILVLVTLLMFISSTIAAASAQQVVATQKGPSSAHKGEYISIQYIVTNDGTQPIYNARVTSQDLDKYLGTINPGEARTFNSKIYIPTDKQVKEDFGPDATVSNPFFIGGFAVSYNDANGSEFTVNSNSLQIPLVSSQVQQNNKTVNSTASNNQPKSIWDTIMEFFNSIIQFFKGLF